MSTTRAKNEDRRSHEKSFTFFYYDKTVQTVCAIDCFFLSTLETASSILLHAAGINCSVEVKSTSHEELHYWKGFMITRGV